MTGALAASVAPEGRDAQVTKELETAKRTNLAIVDQAMLVETEVSAAKDEVRSLAPRFAAGAWGCGCACARPLRARA
jgi:hypothetical protein